MAKRPAKTKDDSARAIRAATRSSADGPPSWIAGYPPWHAESFLAACGAKNRDAGIQLLSAKRAIDDGKPAALKSLLRRWLDPNSRFPHDEGSLLLYAIFRRPNANICEMLLDAGADVTEPGLVSAACRPDFEAVLKRLVSAGANPNLHRSGQSPLVEVAMDSGTGAMQVLKQMLEVGMDVNGTRSICPDNKREVRKCTGLMTAAWRANVEAVRVLLAAGADTQRRDSLGNTALDWARSGKTKSHAKVIELLDDSGAAAGQGADLGVVAIPDFTQAAKSAAFKRVLSELQNLTGSKRTKVESEDGAVKGAYAFPVDEKLGRLIVDDHQAGFLMGGSFVFVSDDVTSRGGTCIVALPTTDCLDGVAAIQTNGINSGVTTADLINWLNKLKNKQPFQLHEIRPDLIRGRFLSAIKEPLALLKLICKLCPDSVTKKTLTATDAKKWAAKRSLDLWWD